MRRPSVATRGEGTVVAATTGIVRHGGAAAATRDRHVADRPRGQHVLRLRRRRQRDARLRGPLRQRRALRVAVADDARRPAAEAARHRRAGALPAPRPTATRRPTPAAARPRSRRCGASSSPTARSRRSSRSRTTASEPVTARVRYEFDCDFLDLFEVKSREFGQRDLAFARTITPLPTERRYDDDENSYAFAVSGQPLPGQRADLVLRARRAGRPRDRLRDRARPARALAAARARRPARRRRARGRATRTRTSAPSAGASRSRVRTWHDRAPALETPSTELGATLRPDPRRPRRAAHARSTAAASCRPPACPGSRPSSAATPRSSACRRCRSARSLAREALRGAGATTRARSTTPRRTPSRARSCTSCASARSRRSSSSFPYYGSVDSTPLFLMLLGETFRWTGDAALARELEPAARRALAWMEGPGDPDGDGYLEFHRRSAARPRGAVLEGLVELDAVPRRHDRAQPARRVRGAGLRVRRAARAGRGGARRPGATSRSPTGWSATPPRCARRFDRDFWIERDGGYYALALDADKRPGRQPDLERRAPAVDRHRQARARRTRRCGR